MLLLFSMIAICAIIGLVAGFGEVDGAAKGTAAFIVGLMFVSVFSIFFWSLSYINYLDAQKIYQGTVAQYKGAIEVYEDKAVINTNQLTDFGHGKYNESMAALIRDLRNEVVHHNKIVIGKRIMSDSIFFNWFIIGEDELKLLEVK